MFCRLCVFECNVESATDIFESSDNSNLVKLIVKYLFLEVLKEDNFSTIVCAECLKHLKEFDSYCLKIQHRQEVLHEVFLSENPSTIAQSNDEQMSEAIEQKFAIPDLKTSLDADDCFNEFHVDRPQVLEFIDTAGDGINLDANCNTSNTGIFDFPEHEDEVLISKSFDCYGGDDTNASSQPSNSEEKSTEAKEISTEYSKIRAQQIKENNNFIEKHADLKCDICGHKLDTFKNFQTHFQREHNQTAYIRCCSSRLKKKWAIINHLKSHLNPDLSKCLLCQKTFSDLYYLKRHTRKYHTDNETDQQPSTGQESKAIFKFDVKRMRDNEKFIEENVELKCELCGFIAETCKNFQEHYRNEHNQKAFIRCCGKKLVKNYAVVQHIKSHLNPDNLSKNLSTIVKGHNEQASETTVQNFAHSDSKTFMDANESFNEFKAGSPQILEFVDAGGDGVNLDANSNTSDTDMYGFSEQETEALKSKNRYYNQDNDTNESSQSSPFEEKSSEFQIDAEEYSKIRAQKIQENEEFIEKHADLKCDICGSISENYKNFQTHFQREHNQRAYIRCCSARLEKKWAIINHLKSHLNPDFLKCFLCQKKFTDIYYLNKHIRRCHKDNETAQHAATEKESKTIIKFDIKRMRDNEKFIEENVELKCELCGFIADTCKNFQQHYRDEHKQKAFIRCCGVKLVKNYAVIEHIKSHLNPDFLRCSFCSKTLSNKVSLNSHIKRYHANEEFTSVCEICGKRFERDSALKLHMKVHEEGKSFKCDSCDKIFKYESTLKAHKRRDHDNIGRSVCHLCGVEYKYKAQFEQHMAKKHDIYFRATLKQCEDCKDWFSLNNLKLHEERHKLQDVECNLCGRILPSKVALDQHKQHHPKNKKRKISP